jgi:hypothetical protein
MSELQADFRFRMASFIEGLPADEAVLIPLYEAYRAANDTFFSLSKEEHIQGMAADIIASESRRMSDFACAVAARLSKLSSIRDHWHQRFLDTLISHVFFVGGNASDALRVQAAARALPVIAESFFSCESLANVPPPVAAPNKTTES